MYHCVAGREWMDGPTIGVAVFACVFSSAILGVYVHARMPSGLLTQQAVAFVRRSVWIVALMAGLLLALLTGYLFVQFDSASRDVKQFSSRLVEMDRTLRQLGPAAEPSRALLFRYGARAMRDIWPQTHPRLGPDDAHTGQLFVQLEQSVSALNREVTAQRDASGAALAGLRDLDRARWAMYDRDGVSLSPWLMGALVFWLMVTFGTLGLSAPRTPLVMGSLFLCAVALGSAVFLAVEYADPYVGIITVSSEPVQNALFALSE
jgi:hypothetical protein